MHPLNLYITIPNVARHYVTIYTFCTTLQEQATGFNSLLEITPLVIGHTCKVYFTNITVDNIGMHFNVPSYS